MLADLHDYVLVLNVYSDCKRRFVLLKMVASPLREILMRFNYDFGLKDFFFL